MQVNSNHDKQIHELCSMHYKGVQLAFHKLLRAKALQNMVLEHLHQTTTVRSLFEKPVNLWKNKRGTRNSCFY